MSAVLAEQPPSPKLYAVPTIGCEQAVYFEGSTWQYLDHEEYGRSLSTLRLLGEVSIAGVNVAETTQLGFDDFTTKLTEMLKTDEDHGQEVDVNRDNRYFQVVDGKARNEVGIPMVDVVQNGYEASRNSPSNQLREVQSIRDEGDVIIAKEVDRLAPGEALIAVSIEPVEQLKGKDGKFWHDLGYREGIAYIQLYCRIDETTMSANAYSVDHSELGRWRKLLLARGVAVPEDIDANMFSRYMYKFNGDLDTAKQAVTELKLEHYLDAGVSPDKIDTKQLLAENEDLVMGMFMTYYPKVGRALVTGENNPVLQDFAKNALQTLDTTKLKPEVARQIVRIANSPRFDDEMARTLSENLIPYATVEAIRTGIKKPRHTAVDAATYKQPAKVVNLHTSLERVQWSAMNEQQVHQLALSGIQKGITAGRSYGGCSGVNIASDQTEEGVKLPGMDSNNQQDVYGGKSNTKTEAGDKHGAYEFNCGKCGYKNDRRKEKGGWVMNCQGCGTDVSCGKKPPEHKKTEANSENTNASVILFPSQKQHKSSHKRLAKEIRQ